MLLFFLGLLATLLLSFVICAVQAFRKDREQWFFGARALFWHITRSFVTLIFGWAQKILLSKSGSSLSSLIIAAWIFLELSGKKDVLAGSSDQMGRLVATVAYLVLYAHLAKLYVEHCSTSRLEASSGATEKVALALSNLTDFFLEKPPSKLTRGYDPTSVVRKATVMLTTYSRGDRFLSVMAVRLTRDKDKNIILHELVALNDAAHEQHTTGGYIDTLIEQLSNADATSKISNYFGYALVDERPTRLEDARFRDGCRVLEDLSIERFLPYGRPVKGVEEGSCVGYTLGLYDGSYGYLILGFSKTRGGLRSRDRDLYALPLRACAMLLMGLDSKIPKILPSTRRR